MIFPTVSLLTHAVCIIFRTFFWLTLVFTFLNASNSQILHTLSRCGCAHPTNW